MRMAIPGGSETAASFTDLPLDPTFRTGPCSVLEFSYFVVPAPRAPGVRSIVVCRRLGCREETVPSNRAEGGAVGYEFAGFFALAEPAVLEEALCSRGRRNSRLHAACR